MTIDDISAVLVPRRRGKATVLSQIINLCKIWEMVITLIWLVFGQLTLYGAMSMICCTNVPTNQNKLVLKGAHRELYHFLNNYLYGMCYVLICHDNDLIDSLPISSLCVRSLIQAEASNGSDGRHRPIFRLWWPWWLWLRQFFLLWRAGYICHYPQQHAGHMLEVLQWARSAKYNALC